MFRRNALTIEPIKMNEVSEIDRFVIMARVISPRTKYTLKRKPLQPPRTFGNLRLVDGPL